MPSDVALLFVIAVGAIAFLGLLYVLLHIDPAWCLSAGLAGAVFSGYWREMGVPLPLDRIVLLVGLACVVLRSPGGRDRPAFQMRRTYWVLAVAGAYALISAVSAGTLRDGGAALLDRFGLVPFAMFATAGVAFSSPRQRSILLGTLVALGAYLAVTAALEALGQTSLVFPSYISDPSIGIHPGRTRGPFVDATEDGLAMFSCGVAAVIAASCWESVWARWAARVVAVLSAVGVVLALQRSLWIGAIVAVVVTMGASRELRRMLPVALAALAALVLGLFVLSPGLAAKAQARGTDQGSIWDRENSDAAGLRMVATRPLLGFGWDRFQAENTPFFRQAATIPLTGTDIILHNVFLSNAVELGLLGFGVWLLGTALAVGAPALGRAPPAMRAWQLGLVALGTSWVVIANFSPLIAPFNHLELWTWAGVLFTHVSVRGSPP